MRLQKTSVIVVAAAAAALSLTACSGGRTNDGAPAGAPSKTPSGAPSESPGPSGSPSTAGSPGGADPSGSAAPGSQEPGAGDTQASSSASGSSSAAGSFCLTSQLKFSSSGGMAEGEVLINMKNAGSSTCTMHGFPSLDLRGKDGTVSAARGDRPVPVVTLAPGEATNFPVHFPPNDSGGSGVTFTSAVVTPPNETHSHSMSLSVGIPAGSGSASRITVEPVGSGK